MKDNSKNRGDNLRLSDKIRSKKMRKRDSGEQAVREETSQKMSENRQSEGNRSAREMAEK